MVNFNGKFKLDKKENFEELLKAKGANFMMRKLAQSGNPIMEIEHDDKKIHVKVYLAVKTLLDITTNFDEDVVFNRPDGTKMKTRFVMEGSKLVQRDTKPDGEVTVNYREFEDPDTIVQTITHENIVCKRWFKRMQ